MDRQISPEWRQSAVMAALMLVQEGNGGYLTTELMDKRLPHIWIWHLLQSMKWHRSIPCLNSKPVGKHKGVRLYQRLCMINGSDRIVEYLEKTRCETGSDQQRWQVFVEGS